ncbi:MAG: glycosyltransferase family 2 protein [Bacilli bacterium]
MNIVSIVVPTYRRNRELVSRAIDSLLNQSYQYIEIVLVDDNATVENFNFRNEIDELVKSYNKESIKYIVNQENLGGALSRNVGISNASGQYITFLDDDDEYEPLKIEKQLDYMIKNDLDVCFSDYSIYNEKGNLVDYRQHTSIKSFDKDYLFKYHLVKQITGTPTFMYKKSVLDEINGFENVNMGQEYYLMSKTILNGYKIGYFNQSNIKVYRTNMEAISTGPNKIIGEKKLYKYKKSYFKKLKFNERNYVRFRHYVVMGFAYKRNRKYFKAIINILFAIVVSPIYTIKELISIYKRRTENKDVI